MGAPEAVLPIWMLLLLFVTSMMCLTAAGAAVIIVVRLADCFQGLEYDLKRLRSDMLAGQRDALETSIVLAEAHGSAWDTIRMLMDLTKKTALLASATHKLVPKPSDWTHLHEHKKRG